MYESFYGLKANPFQLKPDPDFFFGSKGHNRAMAYLEYGLSKGEGFIVITGEIGAGKTTLMRNLFRKLDSDNIVAAQVVNSSPGTEGVLETVAAAFGIAHQDLGKAALMTRFEQFLRRCDEQGKRAFLVMDEAQNLSPRALEELRMLSNFQTDQHSLLQTFLLGQPELRRTLLGGAMEQLRQRVVATCHLGPMDAAETRAYVEHRLRVCGWSGDPALSDAAFGMIHDHARGIPRRINSFCDRMFLMGYLEELHGFDATEVERVIEDIRQEFELPADDAGKNDLHSLSALALEAKVAELEHLGERIGRMERSLISVLDVVKRMLATPSTITQTEKEKRNDGL